MKVWKRAGLYLIRKKSRSIILFLLLFVMANLIMVGNAMRRSADDEIERIRKKLGCSFVVAADTDNPLLYEERFDEEYPYKVFIGRGVTRQLIKEILNVQGVIDYDIKDYKKIWTELDLRPGMWAELPENEHITEEEIAVWRHVTNAVICGNSEMNINFRTGAFSITEGRSLTESDSYSALVSEYFAEKNNLTVGDYITVETKTGFLKASKNPSETIGIPVKLEVAGIFSANFEQEASVFTPEYYYADNLLFVDQTAGLQLHRNQEILFPAQEAYDEATFFVNNPKRLEKVMKDVKQSTDLSELLIYLDDSAYSASIKPLKQISLFSCILVISGSVGAATALYFIFDLWMKSRIHEIKIYMSIGISRKELIRQLLLEGVIITSISLLASLSFAQTVTNGCFYLAVAMTEPEEEKEAYNVEISYEEALPRISKVSAETVKLSYDISVTDIIFLLTAAYGISCVSILTVSLQTIKRTAIKT